MFARISAAAFALLLGLAAMSATAQQDDDTADLAEPPMTVEYLAQILQVLDPDATVQQNTWQLEIGEVLIIVVADPEADRMRAMIPIRAADALTPDDMRRMMQANFDTALDGRYAVAQGVLWATFIHPLKPLEKNQLISGLGQIINLAQSYGSLYSGGALAYGGGDSGALQRDLIDELLRKGEEI